MKIKILFSALLILIIIGAYFVFKNSKTKPICIEFDPRNEASVECFGVLSTSSYDLPGFEGFTSIDDHVRNYSIAAFKPYSNFRFIDNKIYVIEQSNNYYMNGITKKYYHDYYINGKLETLEYASKEEFPKYLIIDILTGNVNLFYSINEVPINIRYIFDELI